MDIVHARSPDNIQRLLAALDELDAVYRTQPERRLKPSASHLASAGRHLQITRHGPLDLLGEIGRKRGYEQLISHTIEMDIDTGETVRVLNLEMLIETKQETGRERDLAVLPILRRTLEEKRHR